jgi:alpha-L-fucosidase 2
MVSPDESLTESHRHFSHLMAIYPLGLIDIEGSDRDRRIIAASLRHLDMLGSGLWVGFSFTWAACMAARCGRPERALNMLDLFLKACVSRNGFNLNGDYKKLGISSWNYRPFTLEANFAAGQAVHEMLLQSWGGVIRVFPAVPAEWTDVSFRDLRAEGAFLVSAQRKQGKTIWVRILAEKAGIIRLKNPFGLVKVKWNRKDVHVDGLDYVCRLEAGDILEGKDF